MNFALLLTFIRVLLIPSIVLFFYLPFKGGHLIAASIFILAALTDWLDGFLARNFEQATRFGAFLDPVADKLIIAVALVIIVGEIKGALIAIPAAVIVGREIVVSALREWMAEIGKSAKVAVGKLGKIKTAVQMVSLVILLLYKSQFSSTWFEFLGIMLLYVAAILTLWSMFKYLRIAWPSLTLTKEKE